MRVDNGLAGAPPESLEQILVKFWERHKEKV